MGDPHQQIAAAGLGQHVVAMGVGGGVGRLAHAGLGVHQHYRIARGGLAGGFIGHRAGELSLCQRACRQQAHSNDAEEKRGRFHGRKGILL